MRNKKSTYKYRGRGIKDPTPKNTPCPVSSQSDKVLKNKPDLDSPFTLAVIDVCKTMLKTGHKKAGLVGIDQVRHVWAEGWCAGYEAGTGRNRGFNV